MYIHVYYVPSGLKPGQRKVLFTCFKRNDRREIKVAQLAGSVAEHSAYHHGEVSTSTLHVGLKKTLFLPHTSSQQSLMSTIINLAQNFIGSNNINLLQPRGQFGTRLHGGKDAASPRSLHDTCTCSNCKHMYMYIVVWLFIQSLSKVTLFSICSTHSFLSLSSPPPYPPLLLPPSHH